MDSIISCEGSHAAPVTFKALFAQELSGPWSHEKIPCSNSLIKNGDIPFWEHHSGIIQGPLYGSIPLLFTIEALRKEILESPM